MVVVVGTLLRDIIHTHVLSIITQSVRVVVVTSIIITRRVEALHVVGVNNGRSEPASPIHAPMLASIICSTCPLQKSNACF